jgi:hypothetical protein
VLLVAEGEMTWLEVAQLAVVLIVAGALLFGMLKGMK